MKLRYMGIYQSSIFCELILKTSYLAGHFSKSLSSTVHIGIVLYLMSY